MNRQELAEKILETFEQKKRDNGEKFWVCSDEYTDLIFHVHDNGNTFPDDYLYNFIYDSLLIIIEHENEEEYLEGIDSSVDIYNSDLLDWLKSSLWRAEYVNEAVSNFGYSEDGLFSVLQQAQYIEREEVFNKVLSYIDEKINEEVTE